MPSKQPPRGTDFLLRRSARNASNTDTQAATTSAVTGIDNGTGATNATTGSTPAGSGSAAGPAAAAPAVTAHPVAPAIQPTATAAAAATTAAQPTANTAAPTASAPNSQTTVSFQPTSTPPWSLIVPPGAQANNAHHNNAPGSFHGRVLANFDRLHLPNQPTVDAEGYSRALDDLAWYVKHRFTTQPTSGAGLLCLLYALQTSLAGFRHPNTDNAYVPTVAYLNQARYSPEYDAIVGQRTQGWDQTHIDQEYYARNNLSSEQASAILATLSYATRVNYRLGIQQWDEALQRFNINLLEPTWPNLPAVTVWIHNRAVTSTLNHWSGFAPAPPQPTPTPPLADPTTLYVAVDRPTDPATGLALDKPAANRTRTTGRGVVLPKVYIYTGTIPDAPPPNTELPYELLSQITDEELIAFYPNHVLFWPALAVRLIEAGWVPKALADSINAKRGLAGKPAALKPNTVRSQLNAAACEYYATNSFKIAERLNSPFWALRTRAWAPPALRAKGFEKPEPAWDAASLAQHWLDQHLAVPDLGRFSRQLATAASRGGFPPTMRAERTAAPNPPEFPKDWKWVKSNHHSRLEGPPKQLRQESALPSYNPATAAAVPADRLGDLEWVVRNHPAALGGETLLDMFVASGATQQELVETINRVRGDGERTEIDRATITKRVTLALQARASREGKSLERAREELQEVVEIVWGKRKRRRLEKTTAAAAAAAIAPAPASTSVPAPAPASAPASAPAPASTAPAPPPAAFAPAVARDSRGSSTDRQLRSRLTAYNSAPAPNAQSGPSAFDSQATTNVLQAQSNADSFVIQASSASTAQDNSAQTTSSAPSVATNAVAYANIDPLLLQIDAANARQATVASTSVQQDVEMSDADNDVVQSVEKDDDVFMADDEAAADDDSASDDDSEDDKSDGGAEGRDDGGDDDQDGDGGKRHGAAGNNTTGNDAADDDDPDADAEHAGGYDADAGGHDAEASGYDADADIDANDDVNFDGIIWGMQGDGDAGNGTVDNGINGDRNTAPRQIPPESDGKSDAKSTTSRRTPSSSPESNNADMEDDEEDEELDALADQFSPAFSTFYR